MNGHWVGFDFDGTLATYDGVNFPAAGDPIMFTCTALQDCLDAGMEVRIVTARAATAEDPQNPHYTAAENAALLEPVRRFCREVFNRELPITAEKDFMMLRLWDDRAVQVIPNIGLWITFPCGLYLQHQL